MKRFSLGAVTTFIGVSLYKRVDPKNISICHQFTAISFVNGFLIALFVVVNFFKWLIFGKLTFVEVKNLKDKLYYTLWEFLIGFFILNRLNYKIGYLDEFHFSEFAKYGGLFVCVLLLKFFHYLSIDRVITIFNSTIKLPFKNAYLTHIRFASGLILLNFIDLLLIKKFHNELVVMNNYNILMVIFGFEIINLYPLIILTTLSYGLNFRQFIVQRDDTSNSRNWEIQLKIMYVAEFLVNLLRFCMFLMFSITFYHFYTIPLHIVPSSYKCFRLLINKTRLLINYKQQALKLNKLKTWTSIPNQKGMNKTGNNCVFCFEELDYKFDSDVKQLRCDHCFHMNCLWNWYTCSNTCPVCRKVLDKSHKDVN